MTASEWKRVRRPSGRPVVPLYAKVVLAAARRAIVTARADSFDCPEVLDGTEALTHQHDVILYESLSSSDHGRHITAGTYYCSETFLARHSTLLAISQCSTSIHSESARSTPRVSTYIFTKDKMAARSLYRTLHLSNLIRAHPIRTPTSIPRRSTRALSRTTSVAARKDTQHKDSLKPEPNEYSKSASDDEAARLDDTAFDPNQTRPEQEQASSSAESPEVSQTKELHCCLIMMSGTC